MPFKEAINIEESLVIKIRNKRTGEITTRVIKKARREMSLWEKFLHFTGLKKQPGTLTNLGKEYAAKLYGNVATGKYIDRIGAYKGTYDYKTSNNVYEATGKLKVDNEATPWGDGNWTALRCKNSGDSDASYMNDITISLNISGGSVEWWAEITFTFS